MNRHFSGLLLWEAQLSKVPLFWNASPWSSQRPTNSQGLLTAKYESQQRDPGRWFLRQSQWETGLRTGNGLTKHPYTCAVVWTSPVQMGITVVSCTLLWLVHRFPRSISPDHPPHTQHLKVCCLITWRHQDSWPLEENNSIRGQRRGLIAQSFCVIKFY